MTPGSLGELASSVRARKRSATEVVKEALAAIDKRNGAINAFTAVTEERALAEAAAVDAALGSRARSRCAGRRSVRGEEPLRRRRPRDDRRLAHRPRPRRRPPATRRWCGV